ncbi:uncharacterized protein LOC126841032 [Adelges cooleyi]|uniref:uncharacterized protein LOC126841032 n=1 Tax=Adelges cooleyi TaxID=133065 RepID=UPI002180747E|nr:uncharacterized protein LOC126841032 [Adelges cooleyi]
MVYSGFHVQIVQSKFELSPTMKFLAIVVLMASAAYAAPAPDVTPVLLPRVHLASPDVTLIKQPYVIQQHEPVFKHVYYPSEPAYVHLPAPYVPAAHYAYPQPAAIYHPAAPSYVQHSAVNYVL